MSSCNLGKRSEHVTQDESSAFPMHTEFNVDKQSASGIRGGRLLKGAVGSQTGRTCNH